MRVLTFNVFDLPPTNLFYLVNKTLSWDRQVRLQKIIDLIAWQIKGESPWDVIFLQELWTEKFRKNMSINSGYSHVVDEMDRVMPEQIGFFEGASQGYGHGLMMLSRHPILEKRCIHFSENGQWRHIDDGEVSVEKGAIAAVIENPQLGKVICVNTHMVARYDNHQYHQQRQSQFDELVKFCTQLKDEFKCPLVVGGDLNFGPWLGPQSEKLAAGIELYNHLLGGIQVGDRSLAHDPAAYKLPEMATYCGQRNPYVSIESDGQQIIDHLLCTDELVPFAANLHFQDLIEVEGREIPYSDHYALEVSFAAKERI